MSETNLTNAGNHGTPKWDTAPIDPGHTTSDGSPAAKSAPAAKGAHAAKTGAPETETVEQGQDVIVNDQDDGVQPLHTRVAVTSYTSPPGRPVLAPSTNNDPRAGQQALDMLNDLPAWVNILAQMEPNPPGSAGDLYIKKMEKIQVDDPEIQQLAKQEGVPPGLVYTNIRSDMNAEVMKQLSQLPGDVATKLKTAYFSPEGTKNLSPELKAQLQSIIGKATETVRQGYGLSANWQGVPVDATEFTEEVSTNYDELVENALNEAVANGTLTQAEADQLRALHYGGSASGVPTNLQQILKNIEAKAAGLIQQQFGFDASWQPTPDVAFFNNVTNGDFSNTFQKLLGKVGLAGLTDTQKTQLAKFLANPNDPSVPEDIKKLGQQIVGQRELIVKYFEDPTNRSDSKYDSIRDVANKLIKEATGVIISKYGLDASWQPTITTLAAPGTDQVAINKANEGLDAVRDLLASITAQVEAMPDSPEKASYLNFLKVIGLALIDLQEAIYALQAAGTDASKKTSGLRMQMQLADLAQQQAAADEAAEKTGKMAGMGPLSDIMDWAMKITIVSFGLFAAPLTGGLSAAIAIAYVVDSEENKGDTLTTQMFAAIQGGCEDLAVAMGLPKEVGTFSGIMTNLLVGTMLSTGNPMIILNLTLQDSRSVEEFVKMCGGNEQAQMITQMVVMMVAQIAMMITMMVLTAGAGTGVAVAGVMRTVTTATKVINTALGVVMACLVITVSGIQLNNNILLAQIDMIRGRSEAKTEELQALIEVFKKLIAKLLAMLQGGSDWITNINNLQGQKWKDASAISTEIAG